MPKKMRQLFGVMFTNCEISNKAELWHEFKQHLAEDFYHQARMVNPETEYCDEIYNWALLEIEDQIKTLKPEKTLSDYGLPSAVRSVQPDDMNSEIVRETSYNMQELYQIIQSREPNLTNDHWKVYHEVMSTIREGKGGFIFIDAPGGTGKTYLLNLILSIELVL